MMEIEVATTNVSQFIDVTLQLQETGEITGPQFYTRVLLIVFLLDSKGYHSKAEELEELCEAVHPETLIGLGDVMVHLRDGLNDFIDTELE